MNRKALAEILNLFEIRPASYELYGDPNEYEAHCLADDRDGWHIYFFERGIRSSEEVYPTEDEACVALLKRIARDPWTR